MPSSADWPGSNFMNAQMPKMPSSAARRCQMGGQTKRKTPVFVLLLLPLLLHLDIFLPPSPAGVYEET